MELFGSSGARGSIEAGFDARRVAAIAHAAGTVWDVDRVAIGRDTRTTGQALTAGAVAGLTACGTDVDRLGIAPTPAIQHYSHCEGIPAVAITASHNPPSDNGIKLYDRTGVELSIDQYQAVETTLQKEEFHWARWDEYGSVTTISGVNDRYVAHLVDLVDRDRIAAHSPRVVIDPGNGAGCLTSPYLFRQLGCSVHTIHAQPDGHFPGRSPEPTPAVLDELCSMVQAVGADLGIAHDGDADRAIFVDEQGELIDGDASLAAITAATLDAGQVGVSAVTASRRFENAVEAAGGTVELTEVGTAYILSRVRALQAAGESVTIAGEGNGGIIFPEYRLVRDGAYTAVRFLELVLDTAASERVEPYRDWHLHRRDIRVENDTARDEMLRRARAWMEGQSGQIRTIDGIRLDRDSEWVLIRPSGTEPLIRIYAEASDRARAKSLTGTLADVLESP